MIRCPKCSALNKDGSGFCNKCGSPLHKTQLRCPMCGTLNPVGNLFCDRCHARLVLLEGVIPPESVAEPEEAPASRVQGISLPTRSSAAGERAGDKEAESLNWLEGLLEPAPEAKTSPSEMALPDAGLPDWIADLAPAEPVVQEEAEAAAVVAPAELPDWLSGLSPAEPAEEARSAPAISPGTELPAWLAGQGEEEPSTALDAPEQEPPPAPAEMPDWLSGLAAAEPAEEAVSAPAISPGTELPAWLAGQREEEPSAALDAPEQEPPPAPAEMPDWLSGLAAAEPAEEAVSALETLSDEGQAAAPQEKVTAEIPAWLADLAPAEAAPESSAVIFTAEETTDTQNAETPATEPAAKKTPPTPAWLQEVTPAPETVSQLPSVPAFTLEEDESLEEETDEDAVFLAEPAEKAVEIPDWLRDMAPASKEEAPAGEALQQAEVPRWLEGLKPPGTGPLSETALPDTEPRTVGEEMAGALIRAEIPTWVQQLRPDTTAAVTAPSPFDEVATSLRAETGPLTGLQGILPALPVVDMPADFQPQPTLGMSTHVLEEAQLWQDLLQHPQSTKRPVARAHDRPGWGELVSRLVVAVMLVLAALVPILGFLPEPLAQPPVQAGVAPLQLAIEGLQAGDTVLVALEYGPAEANEMDHIIEALLTHLMERSVQVVAVSTIPEGEGLIQTWLDWAETRYQPAEGSLVNGGYLPGKSGGIAQFLELSPETQRAALLLVLAARTGPPRWWVEQNAVAGSRALPMGVGLSSAVGPRMRPYLDVYGVQGWLIGLPGTAAYWQARGAPPNDGLTRRLDALLLTQWVAAGLLLAGAAYYLTVGKKGAA